MTAAAVYSNPAFGKETSDFDLLEPMAESEKDSKLVVLEKRVTELHLKLEATEKKLSWHTSGTTCSKPWIILNKAVKIDSLNRIDIHIKNKFQTEKKTRNILGVIRGNQKPDSFLVL